jgi:hypothetical protein
MQRALAGFRVPALARWSAEDARRQVLERDLAAEEAKTRDTRLQVINDKAISVRGSPHAQTLVGLKATQPPLTRKLYRSGLALLVGAAVFLPAMWVAMHIDLRRFSEPDKLFLIPIGVAWLSSGVVAWFVVRAFFGRFLALLGAIGGLNLGYSILNTNGILLSFPRIRGAIGVVVTLWLAAALFLRWRHARRVAAMAATQARMVPPELATSVRKACDDAEALARASLGERWLMLHAVLALAVDPAQVQLGNVPGGAAQAAA